jgi:transcription termination factor Rho
VIVNIATEEKTEAPAAPVKKDKSKPSHKNPNQNPNQNPNPNQNGNGNGIKIQILKIRKVILQLDFEFDGIIESEGVLEMMPDGYGFLRSSIILFGISR